MIRHLLRRLTRRDARQADVHDWCCAAFGIEHAISLPQRGIRHLEETVELYQACGGDRAMAHKLIDFVFDRPPGAIPQEIGGVSVTLLALAAAADVSADACEAAEIARVLATPIEHFTQRNRAKNAAGFDALAYPTEPKP